MDTRPDAPGPSAGLLSVKQASQFLGMSDKWLYGSDVPFVRSGTRRLYLCSSLLEYATQRLSTAHRGARK